MGYSQVRFERTMNSFESAVVNFLSFIKNGHPFKPEDSKSKTIFYLYQEIFVILLLAFIGGYVDAAGYIKFSGLFTSSITGNLVAACSSVYITEGVTARILVSLGFLLGGIGGFFLATRLKLGEDWKVKSISMLLYFLEIVLLLISFGIGLAYDLEIEDHGDSLTDWRLVLAASFMGGSMGMHNAAAKESIPNVPATTVMTMTLVAESAAITQTVSLYLASHSWLRLTPKSKQISAEEKKKMDEKVAEAFRKWVVVTRPLIAFLLGALVGAVLASNITYYSIFVPVFLLATIIIDIYFSWVVEKKAEQLKYEQTDSSREKEEKDLPLIELATSKSGKINDDPEDIQNEQVPKVEVPI